MVITTNQERTLEIDRQDFAPFSKKVQMRIDSLKKFQRASIIKEMKKMKIRGPITAQNFIQFTLAASLSRLLGPKMKTPKLGRSLDGACLVTVDAESAAMLADLTDSDTTLVNYLEREISNYIDSVPKEDGRKVRIASSSKEPKQ